MNVLITKKKYIDSLYTEIAKLKIIDADDERIEQLYKIAEDELSDYYKKKLLYMKSKNII